MYYCNVVIETFTIPNKRPEYSVTPEANTIPKHKDKATKSR